MKNKNAEITTEQIVTLSVIILSLIIILYFILTANLGKVSEQEICHTSVVTRSAGFLTQQTIPLNCKTEYVCITKDGTCEGMNSPEIVKVQNIDDIYKTLADQMANCWYTFGEGKLNYVGSGLTSNLYCSICSQIGFDNSAYLPKNEIDEKDFYNYLATTNDSGKGETYLEYLVGLQSSKAIEDALKSENSNFGTIRLDKQYYIVMGIFNKISSLQWFAAGAAVGGGTMIALALTPFTGGVSLASLPVIIAIAGGTGAGAAAGYFIGTSITGTSGQQFLSPTIIQANSDDFNKLKCTSVNTLS